MVRRWFGRGGPSHPDPPGEVPDEDWAAVVRAWPTAALLPRSLASAVRALVPEFVAAHRWEGAKAVDVDDWMRLLIASQACLPIAHLGLDLYARVSSIVVHGATLVTDGAQRVPDVVCLHAGLVRHLVCVGDPQEGGDERTMAALSTPVSGQ